MRPLVVIDFGSQYTQLIARGIRLCSVYSEVVTRDIIAADLARMKPAGIVLSGSPDSIGVSADEQFDPGILELGVPILGICYGMHVIAHFLGGRVSRTKHGEYGHQRLVAVDGAMLRVLPPSGASQIVWMSHNDSVAAVPPGFRVTALTEAASVAAMEDAARRIFGIQFHPELSFKEHGWWVIESFLNICDCERSWKGARIIESAISSIREHVKDNGILCALSGGVDSTVAALLAREAVGSRLTCAFVDTGLLRLREAEDVMRAMRRVIGAQVIALDRGKQFLMALRGVSDPEAKRKVIGAQFIEAFHQAARESSGHDCSYLLQGTIYSDVIESGGARGAERIKSHHNVGGLPAEIGFTLIEPLRQLFKDEVRAIASDLGVPDEIIWRQPFPGPGLAIRIIGQVTSARLRALRAADVIVRQEIARAGISRGLWSFFAVLVPSVLYGQNRLNHIVVVRAVMSDDAMAAEWARLPEGVLIRISSRVAAEVPRVARVVYDITSKPPGTIDWE